MKTPRQRPRRPIRPAREERNSSPSTGFTAAGLEKSPDRSPQPITAAKSGAQSRKIALGDWFGERSGLVDDCVVVELKAVENMLPVFDAQILTYLKLSGHRLGLLINFNVPLIKDGIKRLIL